MSSPCDRYLHIPYQNIISYHYLCIPQVKMRSNVQSEQSIFWVFSKFYFFVLFIFILVLQLTKSMQINDDEKKTYLNCIKCSRSDQSGISVILESRIRCLCLKHPWTIIIPFSPRDYLEIHGPSKMTESWWPHFFIKLALIQVITQRTFLNFDQKRSKQRFGGRLLPADSNSHFGNRKIFVK